MLIDKHRQHLSDEGFTCKEIDLLINQYGVRSLSELEALSQGFKVWNGGQWCSSSGILFPFTPDFGQLRTDSPIQRKRGNAAKYLTQSGKGTRAFIPEGCRAVTEGFKDAMIATLRNVPTGAIAGVSHYRKALSKDSGHDIIFDSDGWSNPQVFANLIKAGRWTGGKVLILPVIDGVENGNKAGLCELYKAGQELDLNQAVKPRELLLDWPNHWEGQPGAKIAKLAKQAVKLAMELLPEDEQDSFINRIADQHKKSGLRSRTLNRVRKRQLEKIARDEPTPYQEDYNVILEYLGDRLQFNEVTKRFELEGRVFSADEVRPILSIDHGLKLKTQKECLLEIVFKIARHHRFNPIQNYLNRVYEKYKHDPVGLKNLGASLAKTYLQTNDPTSDILLRKTLIGAIARIFDPGCKLDTSTVLVGPQGYKKSTFWEALASPEYFCDDFSDPGNKDHILKLHETWIIEWSELHRLSKREVTHVKQFMATKRDLIRVPYGRSNEWMLRQSIIVGTSNEPDFLTDATGNRRWWVIECPQKIDIEAVRHDRDLIWASVMFAYLNGESWWTDETLERSLENDRKKYQKRDVWHDDIAAYTENRERVSISEILDCIFDLEKRQRSNRIQGRIAKILKFEGFKRLPNPVRHSYEVPGVGKQSKKQAVWTRKVFNSSNEEKRFPAFQGFQNNSKTNQEGDSAGILTGKPNDEILGSGNLSSGVGTPTGNSSLPDVAQTQQGKQQNTAIGNHGNPNLLKGKRQIANEPLSSLNQQDLFQPEPEVIDDF